MTTAVHGPNSTETELKHYFRPIERSRLFYPEDIILTGDGGRRITCCEKPLSNFTIGSHEAAPA